MAHSWKLSASSATVALPTWQWPVDVTRYDCRPDLNADEARELALITQRSSGRHGHWSNHALEILQRLRRPIMDVLKWTGAGENARATVLKVLVVEMDRRHQAFWGWSHAQWVESICVCHDDFATRYGGAQDARSHLLALSYLLCGFYELDQLGIFDRLSLARKVFGRERVDRIIQEIIETVIGLGYRAAHAKQSLPLPICEMLLVHRSPRLEDMTVDSLQARRQNAPAHIRDGVLVIARALWSLGILPEPLPKRQPQDDYPRDPTRGVPVEWLRYCQRWRDTSTLAPKTRLGNYYLLLQTGRWLARTHPEAILPERWTRELAAEYVAAVTRLKIGDWAQPNYRDRIHIGQPMSAKAQAHYLGTVSAFFRDLHDWGWIPHRFDPRRCFATPRSVRALIGPKPRIIADDVWAKLLWAGLNLTETDLLVSQYGQRHFYPLAMARAMALVWLFAGLRSDEVHRLRVGCVRWQSKDVTVPGSQDVLPKEAVCFLEVPTNKTSSTFTKPVDRAVGEAIAEWERMRPDQPLVVDRKTGERVRFLFMYRGRQVAKNYLNHTVIPLLCQKAGIDGRDARGKITSHRARSTIATQLANAKEPMTLFELQMWLGHRHPASTLSYVTTTPTKLAKAYAEAGYFERNLRAIEVLIDPDAIKEGKVANGEPWKFYDLGHGYCTYDFFDQCPHRMACAKCAFYVPKGSSQAQLLESKGHLQKMLQEIPLLEDERAAVEDGLGAVEKLLTRLADVPTPAGPTPRQLSATNIIPLTAISVRPVQHSQS